MTNLSVLIKTNDRIGVGSVIKTNSQIIAEMYQGEISAEMTEEEIIEILKSCNLHHEIGVSLIDAVNKILAFFNFSPVNKIDILYCEDDQEAIRSLKERKFVVYNTDDTCFGCREPLQNTLNEDHLGLFCERCGHSYDEEENKMLLIKNIINAS